jgi:glycosyltransferase involved in cell wall biosynthesis
LNVLHVVPTFYPATYWGGPIFSVYGLCNALASLAECKLRVLTTDAAGPSRAQALQFAGFPVRYEPGYDVFFTRRRWGRDVSPKLLTRLPEMIRWADVVHLTGTYSFPVIPTLLGCRAFGKPVVWSPRGALQRWAGSTRPLAKSVWEGVCNLLLPAGRTVLHVTSQEEGSESALRVRKVSVRCIPNGIDLPGCPSERRWKAGGRLHLLYIGRLDPKKGIENLFAAVGKLPEMSLRLVVCGKGDEEYERALHRLASDLQLEEQVEFRGHVEGEAKRQAFLDADLSVVPSHTENFGMVVVEALAYGVPVVASKGTPWQGLEAKGCGLWVDNSPESLAEAIASMSGKDLAAMGRRGREWMEAEYSWESIARRMMVLYKEMAAQGKGRR